MAGAGLSLAEVGGAGLGVLGLASAIAVGLIFVQAALGKLRHRELLAGIVANYRLLPAALVAPMAVLLPPAELVLGAALLFGAHWPTTAAAAAGAIGLLLAFAAAMGINILRGRNQIDCGCGRAQLRQPLSWLLVGRNLVLSAALLPRLVPSAPPAFADAAIAWAGGLALFVVIQLFNAISALAASPLAAPRR